MSAFLKLVSERKVIDRKRCLVVIDALLDIDAVREKLANAGLNHTAYLLDIAKLDLIGSLYRVPEEKMNPFAKRLFVRTTSPSATNGGSDVS